MTPLGAAFFHAYFCTTVLSIFVSRKVRRSSSKLHQVREDVVRLYGLGGRLKVPKSGGLVPAENTGRVIPYKMTAPEGAAA